MYAVIGGTHVARLPILEDQRSVPIKTPYGDPSTPIAVLQRFASDVGATV